MRRLAPLSYALLLALPAAVSAQEEQPAREPGTAAAANLTGPLLAAARVGAGVAIDGRLDDAAWRAVTPVTRFTQVEPAEGMPASENTEVYVLFDDEALYIGARMHDRTGRVHSRLGRRDSFVTDSDWLYISLDSYHSHLTAYQFSVNPAGVKRDEVSGGGQMGDASWDAVWDVATSVDEGGWTAELRIPFSQLRFSGSAEQVWGLQISRRINRLQEVSVFSFTPKSQPGGLPAWGHLVGLEALKQGKRIEALPYTLARAEYIGVDANDPYRDGSDFYGGAGLDVKYRVSSALTLDATVNPDFGQVELDPAVVNLSAFETSLDEKRPFFVEGNDIFRFGGGGGGGGEGRGGLYYSRRIGRAPQGSLPGGVSFSDRPDAATILGAAKLTGRTASGWSLGFVGALTGEASADWVQGDSASGRTVVEPMSGYAVGRVRRSLRGGQSNIGTIATGVYRDLGDDALRAALRESAFTGGLDFNHEFLNRTWSVEGSLAASHVRGSESSLLRTQLASSRYFNRPDADYLSVDSALTAMTGYTGRLEVGKRAGLHWRGEASFSATSPTYEINDAGFQTTVDRISTGANITYVENSPGRIFRNYRVTASGQGGWNYGADLIEARSSARFDSQLRNYWGVNLNYTRSFATYDDRLTRGGPVTRDLAGNNVGLGVNTDSRRAISGRANTNYSWGESGGWHAGNSFNVSFRPADNWSFSIGPRLDRSRNTAQYLRSVGDTLMATTYGRRYLFAQIDQTTWSMETRLNVNFTPELSLDLYAQPLISSGEYGAPKQLRRPRVYEFDVFGRDAGTIEQAGTGDSKYYLVDPDGTGPAESFTVSDPDFTTLSLRGNAVVRWEWRPGSTLFFVWQQRRAQARDDGGFEFGRDSRELFNARPSNVYVIKLNYWLNL